MSEEWCSVVVELFVQSVEHPIPSSLTIPSQCCLLLLVPGSLSVFEVCCCVMVDTSEVTVVFKTCIFNVVVQKSKIPSFKMGSYHAKARYFLAVIAEHVRTDISYLYGLEWPKNPKCDPTPRAVYPPGSIDVHCWWSVTEQTWLAPTTYRQWRASLRRELHWGSAHGRFNSYQPDVSHFISASMWLRYISNIFQGTLAAGSTVRIEAAGGTEVLQYLVCRMSCVPT